MDLPELPIELTQASCCQTADSWVVLLPSIFGFDLEKLSETEVRMGSLNFTIHLQTYLWR